MAQSLEKKKELDRIQLANLSRLNKTSEMLNSKNNWFYLAIILINVVTLVVAWLLESNSTGVATGVLGSIDYRYLYLLLISLIIIVLCKIIPDYIYLYKKTKCKLFGCVLSGNLISGYYGSVNYKADKSDSVYIESLKVSKVNDTTAKEMVNISSVSNKISSVIYYLLVIILGSIFVLSKTNILLYILAIIGLVFNILLVLVVLYFEKFKGKYLIAIGSLCKFLYRLKLIKDYEKLYNFLVVKLMQYGSVFKSNKLYLICQIICGVLIRLISHLVLFFVVSAFNIASWDILIEVLLKCSILDIVLGMFPMPKGTLLYEIIFLVLFRTTFISGYILYGMVIYRVVRYFLIQTVFGVGYMCGIRKRIRSINNQINEEIKSITE